MRIGIDMMGQQSPGSHGGGRPRGIGRYTIDLLAKLFELGPQHEFVLYYHQGLPSAADPPQESNVSTRALVCPGVRSTPSEAIQALADSNPDELDVLLLTSPMDSIAPAPRKGSSRMLMAAVVYDLIPAIFQERYLTNAEITTRYYRALRNIQQYDLLLSISEATRADFLRMLGIAETRIVNISSASNNDFFQPAESAQLTRDEASQLRDLGIRQPYVFHLGGMDERKNITGLMRAFALLPATVRRTHQLVSTCAMSPAEIEVTRAQAREAGVLDRLVLTNAVADESLRLLYQRCAAFAFPSRYEGFGLPILEAMLCGAPVVAGANSSQVEVVGDAGLLAQADDDADISGKLATVLTNAELAARLRHKAVQQAAKFHWRETAGRTLAAIERVHQANAARGLRTSRGSASKPRIAYFSPLPPKCSGISDYSIHLLNHLRQYFTIDLYHEPGYQPEISFASAEFACRDYRLFPRYEAATKYHNLIYHMGNSAYHRFIYETQLAYPGVLVLHDFYLAGFHNWYGHQPGAPPEHFARELQYSCPEQFESYRSSRAAWADEPGGLPRACTVRGIHMNRRLLDHATRVVTHDVWGREMVQRLFPEHVEKTGVIPHGAAVCTLSAEERRRVRLRFDLPEKALVFSSFGMLYFTKMNLETIEAFAPISREFPQALLLFVGSDAGFPDARAKVAALGLERKVRFLGRQPLDDFVALAGVTDIAINLRRAPTNGETSGSLLTLLAAGAATIVNDVDTFRGFPDTVVKRLRWDAFGPRALQDAMRELAQHKPLREEYGRRASQYVSDRHDWNKVAELYATLIDDSQRGRVANRPLSHAVARAA